MWRACHKSGTAARAPAHSRSDRPWILALFDLQVEGPADSTVEEVAESTGEDTAGGNSVDTGHYRRQGTGHSVPIAGLPGCPRFVVVIPASNLVSVCARPRLRHRPPLPQRR